MALVSPKVSEFKSSSAERVQEREEFPVCVLVVDAAGSVVASNSSAREVWHATSRSLVNLPVVRLLGSGDGVAEPSFAEVQWQVLRSAALDRSLVVLVRPVDGAHPFSMRLCLERAHGGGGTYIATLWPLAVHG